MIGYLRGEVIYLYTDYVLLDVHGVGYRVFIANSTRQKLRLHEKAQLFTYTSVREDAIILYGFATQEEYDLFLQLLSVSGIGPKVALGILSSITVEGLCRAIQNKQASVLTKLPGIGKKSAERLILELKDKVAFDGGEQELLTIENEADVGDDMVAEAMAALQSLGYTQAEALHAMKGIDAAGLEADEIIRQCLKKLVKQ